MVMIFGTASSTNNIDEHDLRLYDGYRYQGFKYSMSGIIIIVHLYHIHKTILLLFLIIKTSR